MRPVRLIALATVIAVMLSPLPGSAKPTWKGGPPYVNAIAYSTCTPIDSPAGKPTCARSATADGRTGRIKMNLNLVSPNAGVLPGAGSALGLAQLAGYGLTTGGSYVPVSMTLHVNSLTASRPPSHLEPATTTMSAAVVTVTVFHTACSACLAEKTAVIGTSMASPSIKNRDITVKLNLSNSKGRVPLGAIVILIAVTGIAKLGAVDQPVAPVAGSPKVTYPDTGTVSLVLDATATRFTMG